MGKFSVHSSEMYDHISDVRKNTWLEKYGVDNPLKLDVNREKAQVALGKSLVLAKANKQKRSDGLHRVLDRVKESVAPQFEPSDYQGCHRLNKYDWKCLQCLGLFSSHVDYGSTPKCPVCYPQNVSDGHRSLMNHIKSLGVEFTVNDRAVVPGYELDLWIPSKRVGIEYNGVYWHSDAHKDQLYHVNKWAKANESGIRLIQIFSDEYANKRDLIHSRISALLGVDERIFARKTQIVELSPTDYRKFVDQYHIQGYAPASVKLGLKIEDELVACMSFGSSRYDSTSPIELIRYCSKGTVIGGASKLFKHYVNTFSPDSVVSYADRLWSSGGLYTALGFIDVTSHPHNVGYFWVKGDERLNRQSTTKKTLIALGSDPKLTEDQIMRQRGFMKCWDAGNLKYRWVRH